MSASEGQRETSVKSKQHNIIGDTSKTADYAKTNHHSPSGTDFIENEVAQIIPYHLAENTVTDARTGITTDSDGCQEESDADIYPYPDTSEHDDSFEIEVILGSNSPGSGVWKYQGGRYIGEVEGSIRKGKIKYPSMPQLNIVSECEGATADIGEISRQRLTSEGQRLVEDNDDTGYCHGKRDTKNISDTNNENDSTEKSNRDDCEGADNTAIPREQVPLSGSHHVNRDGYKDIFSSNPKSNDTEVNERIIKQTTEPLGITEGGVEESDMKKLGSTTKNSCKEIHGAKNSDYNNNEYGDTDIMIESDVYRQNNNVTRDLAEYRNKSCAEDDLEIAKGRSHRRTKGKGNDFMKGKDSLNKTGKEGGYRLDTKTCTHDHTGDGESDADENECGRYGENEDDEDDRDHNNDENDEDHENVEDENVDNEDNRDRDEDAEDDGNSEDDEERDDEDAGDGDDEDDGNSEDDEERDDEERNDEDAGDGDDEDDGNSEDDEDRDDDDAGDGDDEDDGNSEDAGDGEDEDDGNSEGEYDEGRYDKYNDNGNDEEVEDRDDVDGDEEGDDQDNDDQQDNDGDNDHHKKDNAGSSGKEDSDGHIANGNYVDEDDSEVQNAKETDLSKEEDKCQQIRSLFMRGAIAKADCTFREGENSDLKDQIDIFSNQGNEFYFYNDIQVTIIDITP